MKPDPAAGRGGATGRAGAPDQARPAELEIHPRKTFGLLVIFRGMLGANASRSALALTLMIAQAFLFNAVFFTYGLVLAHFYGVAEQRVGLYLLPLALGNFAGPLALGHLFDTVGRRKMIAGTFGISARYCSLRRPSRSGQVICRCAPRPLPGCAFFSLRPRRRAQHI